MAPGSRASGRALRPRSGSSRKAPENPHPRTSPRPRRARGRPQRPAARCRSTSRVAGEETSLRAEAGWRGAGCGPPGGSPRCDPAADWGAALTWQPEAQQQAVVDDGRVPQAAAIAVVRQEGAVVEVEVVVLHRPALPARRRPPAPHALGAGGAAPAAGGTGTGTGTSRSAPGRAAQGRGAGRGRGQPQPQPLPQAARPRPPAPPLPPAGRGPPAPGGGTAAAEARRDERRAPGTAGGLESSELFPH